MAKGGGGEGHYDERQRSKGKADSPEVLAAISKPRKSVTKKAPTIVVKKKKVIPSRVKVESNPGKSPPEPGTTMTTTRLNVGRLKPQNTGFVTPPRAPPNIIPQNYGFSGPGPSFGGPTPNDTPDLTQQDSNFMRPDLRPQNTGFVTPTPMERARDKAGGGRRLEDMIDAYLKRARPGGGYP